MKNQISKEKTPRCETCKHWSPVIASGGNLGTCMLGFDGIPGMHISLGPMYGESGFVSGINTEKTFGCTNHEDKNTPKP